MGIFGPRTSDFVPTLYLGNRTLYRLCARVLSPSLRASTTRSKRSRQAYSSDDDSTNLVDDLGQPHSFKKRISLDIPLDGLAPNYVIKKTFKGLQQASVAFAFATLAAVINLCQSWVDIRPASAAGRQSHLRGLAR